MLLLDDMPNCTWSQLLRRAITVGIVFALVVLPASANAQAFVEIRAGAHGSSILVRDSINQAITIQPRVAPSVVIAAGSALNETWLLSFSVRWTKSDLMRREADQEATILPLTVWTGMLAVRRSLTDWAFVEGSIGGIKYAPGGTLDGTIFQADTPLLPSAGLSGRVEKGLGNRWGVGLELSYDFHRFTTQALREVGIGAQRSVHRIAMSIVLKARFSGETR